MLEILPQSENDFVAIQIGGKLTAADYENIWVPRLEEAITKYGKVRVLVYLDETFDGWETAVLWEDTKFGLKNIAAFEKIAVVGLTEGLAKVTEILGHLMPAVVKTFPAGELEEATTWVR